MPFLPIARFKEVDSGRERIRFEVVIDLAHPEDATLLQSAAAAQNEADLQALLGRKFDASLEHLRELLMHGRNNRPPAGGLRWLKKHDERLARAVAAAQRRGGLEQIKAEVAAYWDGQEYAALIGLSATNDKAAGRRS